MQAPFVAGFDGSATAADAVRVAARLAAGTGSSLVVAHAYAAGAGAFAHAASDELLAHAGEPGARLRSIAAHSAVEGLRDIARHEGAALLAVGRTHHGPVGRALADSVPDQLLAHAPCPVLVVPPGRRGATGIVGVAFDAGDASLAALSVAHKLARGLGARVVLLSVADSPFGLPFDRLAYSTIECRVLHGAPGPAVAAACAGGIDLLVAGSRGYGPRETLVAGSVSRHLAHHAPCPVLVVPRGAGDRVPLVRSAVSAA